MPVLSCNTMPRSYSRISTEASGFCVLGVCVGINHANEQPCTPAVGSDAAVRTCERCSCEHGKPFAVEFYPTLIDCVQSSGTGPAGELQQLWSGSWSLEDANVLCTAGGNGFQVWDLRKMEQTQEVENAHEMPVRDVAFAGPQQSQLATCGDDCAVRLWDIRFEHIGVLGSSLCVVGD